MKFFRKFLLVFSFTALGTCRVLAADCDGILRQGIWESHSVSSTTTQSGDFANWMCSNSSSSTGFNLGYYGFGIGFTNDEADAACSSSQGRYFLQDDFKINHKVAAQGIVDAWKGCMTAQGAHASLQFGQDPSKFDIVVSFFTPATNRATVSLSTGDQSVFDHCDQSKRDILKGLKIVNTKTISCQRSDLNAEIHINYDFGWNGAGGPLIVPKYVPRPNRNSTDYTGSYGVGASLPCNGANGFAAIYKQGNDLWGRNECNSVSKIGITAGGDLVMGGVHGKYSAKLETIFWENNSQWINTKHNIPILGTYQNPGPHCGSGAASVPTIKFNSEGHLVATNECSQSVHLILRPNGSVEAHAWGDIVGTLANANTLNWSNRAVWIR